MARKIKVIELSAEIWDQLKGNKLRKERIDALLVEKPDLIKEVGIVDACPAGLVWIHADSPVYHTFKIGDIQSTTETKSKKLEMTDTLTADALAKSFKVVDYESFKADENELENFVHTEKLIFKQVRSLALEVYLNGRFAVVKKGRSTFYTDNLQDAVKEFNAVLKEFYD